MKCVINHCDEEVFANQMCVACNSWDYYHTSRRHGVAYFLKLKKKYTRLKSRVDTVLKLRGVRKSA